MREFTTAIEIDAPVERVWAVMSDIDRWHEWTPSIAGITWQTEPPLAVGTRVSIRQPQLPPANWEVVALDPGRSFTWVSAGPGLRVTGHHQVESAGRGSRATLSIRMQGLFGVMLGWVTKETTERYIDFEAKGLKARSENPGFRHGE